MHSRAQLIPLLKDGGEAIQINLPLVLMDPIVKALTLTLLTSNRALNPSWTGLFAQISLVRVAVFTVITPTIVPFYHRCDICGSLKPHCEDNMPPLMLPLMWPLLNQRCLPILSLGKDSWLPNHLTDRSPLNLPLLVPLITRSS